MVTIAKSSAPRDSGESSTRVESGPQRPRSWVRSLREETSGSAGVVRVTLRRDENGLFVEREEQRPHGPLVQFAAAFADLSAFERWCDEDPLRFAAPVLHKKTRQDAENLWREAP